MRSALDMRRVIKSACVAPGVCVLLLSTACGAALDNDGVSSSRRRSAAPQKSDPLPPPEKDIVAVAMFINSDPWLSFDPGGDQNPEGLRLTVWLQSGKGPKPVYADGTIQIEMYRIVKSRDGKRRRELAKQWTFDRDQAALWLPRQEGPLGWPYCFRLNWGEVDVYGRDIEIVAKFIAQNGQIITGRPASLKVAPRRESV